MSTLTAWKFDDPGGAEEALERVQALAGRELIRVDDAALVSWPTSRRRPETRQLRNLTGAGALWGGSWGLLFGLLFTAPVAGLTVGAVAGAVQGRLADIGIEDAFIAQVRDGVTPGTSVLFLLSHGAVVDRVSAELADLELELVRSNLDPDQERRLRAALAQEE